MNTEIKDVGLWASTNGYTLHPQSDSQFITVCSQGIPVGVVCHADRQFTFKSLAKSAPDDILIDQVVNSPVKYLEQVQEPTSTSSSSQELTDMVSRSFSIGLGALELTKLPKDTKEIPISEKASGTGYSERILDCNYWLPYAAEHYNISRDIRDYVLIPIPSIFSGLPNTNGESLSLAEMLAFKPTYGMQMYKTFKGQPTHVEHANKDITKAKGVILESFLRPIKFNPKYYKIVLLLAFDRTKDSVLVNQILAGEVNSYSVGFYYSSYTCSICGSVVGRGINLVPCSHTKFGVRTYKTANGNLAYRKCQDGKGFECSAVNTPAFVSAIGPHLLDPRSL